VSQPNPAQALRRSVDEPEAFGPFYERFFESILVYLTRRVYNPETALDLTAETFAQAYLSRSRFRGSASEEAEAWIYRIAQRKLLHYFRRSTVERRAMGRLRIQAPRLDADRRARIEELAELDGLRSALRSALTELSPAQRDAVRLRALEELPYAEIARRLGISEPAARARVSRGLKGLAVALGEPPKTEEART
jgi:RNA polymerase sigma-70 factor (ECF subfamily)